MLGFTSLTKKVFGTKNGRQIKSIQSIVEKINSLETSISSLSDGNLSAKTEEFVFLKTLANICYLHAHTLLAQAQT